MIALKRIIVTLFAFSTALSIVAVPAYRGKRIALQPDGSQVEYYVHGDETYHYMIDHQGSLLERGTDGFIRKASGVLTQEMIQNRRTISARKPTPAIRRVGESKFPTKGLVILVNFSDLAFNEENTKEAFDEMLNGDNYTYNGATGSVKQYFSDQSFGMFIPTFEVFGPVTLSKPKAYYGGNDRNGNDSHVGEMVREACELVYLDIVQKGEERDLSEFDNDKDGFVDFVDIIYAGYGEADSDDADAIWPCEWELKSSDVGAYLSLGDTRINTFSCHQEKHGYGLYKGKRAGIGTPCHEFAHVFGLPDMYDTSYRNVTLGNWDLMDGGAYNNNSRTPPGFSGYERLFAGWVQPRLINSQENIELLELQSSQQLLLISTTGQHNLNVHTPFPSTFYLLENRQRTGWDSYLPGHGMLIWRIIYNQFNWIYNIVNNKSRDKQGVTILPADGEIYSITSGGVVYTYGDAGDTYPGAEELTCFLNLGAYTITDIKEQNGVISFKFMGGIANDTIPPTYKTYNIEYETENVIVEPFIAQITDRDTLHITLIPEKGYEVDTTDILITMGNIKLNIGIDYSYENHLLTIPNVQNNLHIHIIAHELTEEISGEQHINYKEHHWQNLLSCATANAVIRVYSMTGQLIEQHTGNHIFQLPEGIYFLEITDNNKTQIYKIQTK